VPPKGFFPEPRPSNLITLPCCLACNQSYSGDDEIMRVWFSMGLGHTKAAEQIIEEKVLPGTLTRNVPFRESLLNSMTDAVITDEDGNPMQVGTYPMDRVRTERFVIRVAKGLLRNYYPDYDASQDRWSAMYMGLKIADLALIESLKNLPYFDFRGDGVINYRFGFTREGYTGIWVIVFYGTALFLVTHTHGNWELPNEVEEERDGEP
jgi:hypothetical protein